MSDRRPLIVLAVFLVAVVGGGVLLRMNSGDGATAAINSAHDPVSSTTSSTTSTTSPAGGAQVDWQAQLNRVTAGENSLFQKPDPNAVGKYMAPTCSCYGDTVQRITNLQTHNWHVAGDALDVKSSTYLLGTATSVTLLVQPTDGGYPTVDSKGKIIEAAPVGASLPLIYVLDKGSDGVWRIADRHLTEEQIPR